LLTHKILMIGRATRIAVIIQTILHDNSVKWAASLIKINLFNCYLADIINRIMVFICPNTVPYRYTATRK
jgi:hypothetical protein